MPSFICTTCGTQFGTTDRPPAECKFCTDERQFIGWGGQQWTTLDELGQTHRNVVRLEELGLYGIGTAPSFAIGQRALLVTHFHERTIEVDGRDQAVVVMVDFNDEPFNRSLVAYALSERIERRVKSKRSKNPYLLNLPWDLIGQGDGTHFYDGTPGMLDQILVNRPVLRDDSPFEVDPTTLEILKFPEITTNSGSPRRFGRPSSASSFDDTGFSDHFPVAVVLTEN